MIHFVGKGFLTASFLCALMQLFSWQPSFSDGVLELTTLGNKLSLKLLFLHVNLVLQGVKAVFLNMARHRDNNFEDRP